jgi:hypothetical protein
MSLRDELRDIYLKRSMLRIPVLLPFAQKTVNVRPLTLGERNRMADKNGGQIATMVLMLCVEDPESGELLYNANALDSTQEADMFAPQDSDEIVSVVLEHSGMGDKKSKEGKEGSTQTVLSNSSSPSDTVFLLPNSETS